METRNLTYIPSLCSAQGRRFTTVVSVDPKKEYSLKLSNGECIPNNTELKRIKTLVTINGEEQRQRTLVDHPGVFRQIQDFKLVKLNPLKDYKIETERGRVGNILKTGMNQMRKKAQAGGFAPMDMFHRYGKKGETDCRYGSGNDGSDDDDDDDDSDDEVKILEVRKEQDDGDSSDSDSDESSSFLDNLPPHLREREKQRMAKRKLNQPGANGLQVAENPWRNDVISSSNASNDGIASSLARPRVNSLLADSDDEEEFASILRKKPKTTPPPTTIRKIQGMEESNDESVMGVARNRRKHSTKASSPLGGNESMKLLSLRDSDDSDSDADKAKLPHRIKKRSDNHRLINLSDSDDSMDLSLYRPSRSKPLEKENVTSGSNIDCGCSDCSDDELPQAAFAGLVPEKKESNKSPRMWRNRINNQKSLHQSGGTVDSMEFGSSDSEHSIDRKPSHRKMPHKPTPLSLDESSDSSDSQLPSRGRDPDKLNNAWTGRKMKSTTPIRIDEGKISSSKKPSSENKRRAAAPVTKPALSFSFKKYN